MPSESEDHSGLPTGTDTQTGATLIQATKLLGSSLDALVRSVRSQSHALDTVAERTTALWGRHAGVAVTFRPTSLMIAERTALEAEGQEGRWLLPAFMSGLREVKARPDLTVDDMLQLAQELAVLEPTAESTVAFEDWLWGDGAEGFEVDLQPSFVEIMENVLSVEEGWAAGIAAVRAGSIQSLAEDAVPISARDLDEAAVRPEFRVELDAYSRQVRSPGFALSTEEREALQRASDDSSAWGCAEMMLALTRPEMRSAVPPQRLARRLVALVTTAIDLDLLRLLTRLAREEDPYTAELLSALADYDVGTAIGRGLRVEQPGVIRSLLELAEVSPPSIVGSLIAALLARAGRDPAAFELMTGMLNLPRETGLMDYVDLETLGEEAAVTLLRALRGTGASSMETMSLFDQVGAGTAVALLGELPGSSLDEMEPLVERLLSSVEFKDLEALTLMLLDGGDERALRMIGSALSARHGEGWRRRTLEKIAHALVDNGLARPYLVDLVRDRDAAPRSRLVVLETLAEDETAAAEAVAWRPTQVVDPPEVRQRIRQIRSLLKKGR